MQSNLQNREDMLLNIEYQEKTPNICKQIALFRCFPESQNKIRQKDFFKKYFKNQSQSLQFSRLLL